MISIKYYLSQAQQLIDSGKYTDGCTTPFKNYIHRWLKKSFLLCAAHDFGSLGYIEGVRPGWNNNWITWLAHMANWNPIYWVWGTIVVLITLPWVIWRRNLNKTSIPFIMFHIIIYIIPFVLWILIKIRPYIING